MLQIQTSSNILQTKTTLKIFPVTTKITEIENNPIIIIAGTDTLDFTHFIVGASYVSGAKTNKMVRRTRKPAITVESAWSMS